MSVTQIESIVERLQRSANVRSVYGDPIEHGDRTVVPVARVAFGFGGGFGRGPTEGEATDESEPPGEGGGAGGGAAARPVGALEITDDGTRFVRFEKRRRSLALLVVGAVVGVLVGRRSRGETQ